MCLLKKKETTKIKKTPKKVVPRLVKAIVENLSKFFLATHFTAK